MKYVPSLLLILICLSSRTSGQPSATAKIREALATSNCTRIEEVSVGVCKYDYVFNDLNVEAITFRPERNARFPGILMVPGFQRTALDLISLGV
ncbi:MAG TPA: hypothetical protein VF251_09945, partial [Pyrinomonadaceae bacterium]